MLLLSGSKESDIGLIQILYVDGETERKLSSYHLKTAYLFTLENTPPEDFELLEQGKDYLKAASMILERLSKALETGYLLTMLFRTRNEFIVWFQSIIPK